MNRQAEKHIASAQRLIASGELYYRKAAKEIRAAQKADTTLTNREIGERFGKSKAWVQQIVSWGTTDQGTGPLPFSEAQGSVAHRHAKSVLKQASDDQIEELLEALPARQVKRIAEASTSRLPAFNGSNSGPLDMSHLPKTDEAKLNRKFQELKDLWVKSELSPSKRRRFVDKVAAWIAKVAAEDIEYV